MGSLLQAHPPYKLSKYISERDGGLHNALLVNYAASAGLTCAKDFSFVGILQPHAFELASVLTDSELQKLKLWEEDYGEYTAGASSYEQRMRAIYNLYEEGLVHLNEKFEWCAKADFKSFRKLFNVQRVDDYYR